MTATVQSARATGLEAVRMLASLGWVVVATALVLGALGQLPGWLAGADRDLRPVATLDEAERLLGARLALPSFYPSHLSWPPAQVRVAGGPGGAAALGFRQRDGGAEALVLFQAVTPGAPIPAELLEVGSELTATRARVGPRPATLARVLVGGVTWSELRWERDGRAMVLRTRGDLDELHAMAQSTHLRGAAP